MYRVYLYFMHYSYVQNCQLSVNRSQYHLHNSVCITLVLNSGSLQLSNIMSFMNISLHETFTEVIRLGGTILEMFKSQYHNKHQVVAYDTLVHSVQTLATQGSRQLQITMITVFLLGAYQMTKNQNHWFLTSIIYYNR